MSDLVITKNQNGVKHVIINRPEKRNCLNQMVLEQLYAVISDCYGDEEIRAILLYGQGDEAFCAGADLDELLGAEGVRGKKEFFRAIADLISLMNSCPKAIIAKIHGFALAGGCGLAAAADITIASQEAYFGLPEIHIGMVPMVAMVPIHRAIGRKALMDLVLTGERIGADKALDIGLVSRVFPKDALDEAAVLISEKIAGSAPLAIDAAKEAVYDVAESDYFTALRSYADRISLLSLTSDVEEGISAFLGKRSAKWNGR